MIIFKYEVNTVNDCHLILNGLNIPGEKYESEELDHQGSKIVWKGEKFVALFHPEENKMELYPTKNTNSINHFILRYNIEYDSYNVVKTKKWD